LFVGGLITRVGEVPVNNVAHWNGTSWSSLGSGAANGVDGEVFALSTTSANVYVGGAFTHAGGQAANHVARFDGTWHTLGSDTANGTDAAVGALASASDATVYAGGNFIHAGGQVVNYIAEWNGTTWSPLASAGGVGVCGSVSALAAYNGGVYAGGNFPDFSGCPPGVGNAGNHVSYWSGSQWNYLLEAGPILSGGDNRGTSRLVSGNALYGGGVFRQVDTGSGGIVLAPGAVRWRNGGWNALASGLANEIVLSLGLFQGKLYAASRDTSVWRFDE